MKKIYLLLLCLAMLAFTHNAQASTVTLKTDKAVGETLTLALNADMNVTLTWGDGTTIEFYSNGQPRDVEVKAATLTITTDKDITALYVCEDGLTELDVTGAATSLERLFCSDNSLTQLDLSKCTNLTDLDCQDNQLTTLNIVGSGMKYVNIAGNQLTATGLRSNNVGNIVSLVCAGNKMTTISYLSSMTKLETLLCQGNQLSSLSISKCKELANLVANNNQLVALNAPALTKLNDWYIDNNQLETLDLSNCLDIWFLSARNNKLKELTWAKKYEGISYVNLANNNLFFNSFPTIYNYSSQQYTLNAILTPQRPYHLMDVANINETYALRDVFVINGWSSGVNATLTMTDANGETLVSNTDYTYKNGQLTFLKAHPGVVISAVSRYYPDIVLTTEPFNVIDPLGIFTIDDGETKDAVTVYDLQGRKASHPHFQKGIYIVNGKKTIIR